MPVTDLEKQLREWMGTPEGLKLEFKEAKNTFDFEKLVQYCVALANEGGGHLILGVTDKSPRKIVGSSAFKDTNQVMLDLLTKLRFRVNPHDINTAEGRVLVFDIPSRPIGTPLQYQGTYWMRAGEGLVGMSTDTLTRIIHEAEPDYSATLCKNSTLDDLDLKSIDRFRQLWITKSKKR